MGLGVWFVEDIAAVLRGVGEGVSLLVAHRGLRDEADAAYVAGRSAWAALRAVATSLGLGPAVSAQPPGFLPDALVTESWTAMATATATATAAPIATQGPLPQWGRGREGE